MQINRFSPHMNKTVLENNLWGLLHKRWQIAFRLAIPKARKDYQSPVINIELGEDLPTIKINATHLSS